MTQQRSAYPLDYSNGPAEKDDHAGKVQEDVGKVSEQVREYSERAQEVARNFRPYVEKSMKEQPVATLAVASVIGFALGALWKK
jgi:ElaB/YqjD/DUF883 family membrane-anchored ribosome-binding protein